MSFEAGFSFPPAPKGFRYTAEGYLEPVRSGEYSVAGTGRPPRKQRGTLRALGHAVFRCVDGLAGVVVGAVGGAVMGAGSLAMHGGQTGLTGITQEPWTLHMDNENKTGFSVLGEDAHRNLNFRFTNNGSSNSHQNGNRPSGQSKKPNGKPNSGPPYYHNEENNFILPSDTIDGEVD